MNAPARFVALVGAILGFSAVILAALGSHVVDMQNQAELQRIWQTASIIHLFQAAALLGLAALLARMESRPLQWGSWLVIAGTLVFCGSLYLRVITAGSVTGTAPAGGLLMMAGWLLVALAFLKKS